MAKKHNSWWEFKAKIVARYGTITAFAQVLGCSPEALRGAVRGQCPRVMRRMKEVLG